MAKLLKVNLEDRKLVVLTAAILSCSLSFVILKSLLTNPGLIEAIDIQWNQNFSMFQYLFHTWNFYNNGSNIIFVSQFPIYGWVLVFGDVGIAQRFVYFVIVSLISFNMFLVAFYTLKKTVEKTYSVYLAAMVAALFYTLNPLMFSEIFHVSFLWSYALFPLVFYFFWQSFNAPSFRKVLLSALLLSPVFAFMADAWGMLIGLSIVVLVGVSNAVLNGRKNLFRRFIPNVLLTLLITSLVTAALAAYWVLPYFMQRASEPVWDPFSVVGLIRNSAENSLTNVMGLHGWSYQTFFDSANFFPSDPALSNMLFNAWIGFAFILPLVAISVVLIKRNKLTLSLSGMLVVGVFLATGAKYVSESSGILGVGDFYRWLTFYSPRIIPNQAFLLKYPYLFLAIVSLAVALLLAVLIVHFFKMRDNSFNFKKFSFKKNPLPIVLFFTIITIIGFVGLPLLTNLSGALSPTGLPDAYEDLNEFFDSQDGSFRVMWVPQETNFDWSNNSWANKIEFWGSGATPLMYGWGISASPNTGFLGDLIYDYMLQNQTDFIGKLLALANVKYVVFHNDTNFMKNLPSLYENNTDKMLQQEQYQNTTNTLLQNLKSQKDLVPVFSRTLPSSNSNNTLTLIAFENTETINSFQAFSKANLVVGGLGTLGSLSSIPGLNLNDSAFLFIESNQLESTQLNSILTSNYISKNIIFYGDKTFDDFILDTLNTSALVFPGDVFISTSETGWLKDSATSYSWTPNTLGNYVDENASAKFDFALGHNILYSFSSNENLTFSVNINETGPHEFWARVLYSPNGGKLSFSIDGNYSNEQVVNTNTAVWTGDFSEVYIDSDGKISLSEPIADSTLTGFRWVRLDSNITLSAGIHTISINNEEDKFNAVNVVALPTADALEEHKRNLLELVDQSNVRVLYVIDQAFLRPLIASFNVSTQAVSSFRIYNNFTIGAQNYSIPFDVSINPVGSSVRSDEITIQFSAIKQSKYTINIELNQQLDVLSAVIDTYSLNGLKSTTFAEGDSWYSLGPIDLSLGSHNITLSKDLAQAIERIVIYSSDSTDDSVVSLQELLGGGSQPYVLGYEKTDPVSFSVTINSTDSFFLLYNEPYDEFWESNASDFRFVVNSINNGYLIEGNSSNQDIIITYIPETSLQLGLKISAAALVLTFVAVALILLIPKLSKRGNILMKRK